MDLGLGSCGCNVHLSFYKLQLTNHNGGLGSKHQGP
jgi:hypothetical protein